MVFDFLFYLNFPACPRIQSQCQVELFSYSICLALDLFLFPNCLRSKFDTLPMIVQSAISMHYWRTCLLFTITKQAVISLSTIISLIIIHLTPPTIIILSFLTHLILIPILHLITIHLHPTTLITLTILVTHPITHFILISPKCDLIPQFAILSIYFYLHLYNFYLFMVFSVQFLFSWVLSCKHRILKCCCCFQIFRYLISFSPILKMALFTKPLPSTTFLKLVFIFMKSMIMLFFLHLNFQICSICLHLETNFIHRLHYGLEISSYLGQFCCLLKYFLMLSCLAISTLDLLNWHFVLGFFRNSPSLTAPYSHRN